MEMRLLAGAGAVGRAEQEILTITGRGPGALLVLVVFLLLRPALKETVVLRRR